MPNKFNAERRHHIPKMKSTVTNWAVYEADLRRRGSLTMWITEDAISAWHAAPRATPGGQATYSDGVIETCLMLRTAFKLPLRQAEGLMLSVVELLGREMAVPDHTTVSRRAMSLPSIAEVQVPNGPLHVLIDSTGLKVYGAGEWLVEKHGQKSRRGWRKLHLAVHAHSGQIVASVLTEQDVDDPSQVGPLLEQIPQEIEQVTADGAYDGEPTYETIARHDPDIAVVIPIESLGRLGWQDVSGYGNRALVETAMGRYKSIVGARLRARDWRGQKTEAAIGVAVLNRMLAAGRPNSVRTARSAS
jgi:hypothetical protein